MNAKKLMHKIRGKYNLISSLLYIIKRIKCIMCMHHTVFLPLIAIFDRGI